MNAAIARLRSFVAPAAWMFAVLVSSGVLHAVAGRGLVPAARGVAAVACVLMAMSLVIPAVSVARAWNSSGDRRADRRADWRDDLRRWGATVGSALGGVLVGLVVYTLACAAEAAPAVIASLVVIASCAISFAALGRSLARLLAPLAGGRLPGAGLAGAALLALTAVPFWTGGLVRTGAGFAWSGLIVGASPFLAAATPWAGAGGPWRFDPRTSPVLYGIWVGTDVPMAMPGWIACAAGHLIFGLLVIALVEVLPRFIGGRKGARAEPQSEHPARSG